MKFLKLVFQAIIFAVCIYIVLLVVENFFSIPV